jgi:integrase
MAAFPVFAKERRTISHRGQGCQESAIFRSTLPHRFAPIAFLADRFEQYHDITVEASTFRLRCFFEVAIHSLGEIFNMESSHTVTIPYPDHFGTTIRSLRVAHSSRASLWIMTEGKQNVTISIAPETVRKAKILAARRATSISRLLAEEIEALVAADDEYERSQRAAFALLADGFHLGGRITVSRDELHER